MAYIDGSIEEIKVALSEGKTTALELTEESLKRAKEKQKELNTFVTITDKEAIEQVESKTAGLLSGIPYGLKDNFSTKGILSTASSNILKDYVPIFNATVYNRLQEAGAVLIGKTVLDELAMGGTGTTGHTGTVNNPHNTERLIGGSSAGSAAAVASGIVPFAIGSDTGDSVRKPAAFGGVVGFKPTWGKISRYGLFPFACSLDTVAYFTRSVKDAATLTEVLKGRDGYDMTVYEDDKVNVTENLSKDVKGKKLFVIKELVDRELFKDEMTEDLEAIFDQFDKTVEKAKEAGMTVEEVSFPVELLKAVFPSYMVISCAEATSNNSNLTGIIFGPRGQGNTPAEIMFDARTKGFSELIKRRFVLGSYVLMAENQEKLFLNAQRARRMIVEKMNELFETYDGYIAPSSGSIAPKEESENIDKLSYKALTLENHLVIGNFGGFPSISIPNGYVNGMPISVNITGRAKDDLTVLSMAYALEDKLDFKYLNKEAK